MPQSQANQSGLQNIELASQISVRHSIEIKQNWLQEKYKRPDIVHYYFFHWMRPKDSFNQSEEQFSKTTPFFLGKSNHPLLCLEYI